MTLSELKQRRRAMPYWIAIACATPAVALIYLDTEAFQKVQVIVALMALIFAFGYNGFGVRDRYWQRENENYVGQTIRNGLITLIPDSADVTPAEEVKIREWEIFKQLTGVFWEAVDSDERISRYKPHFYENGFLYTTAIDAWIVTSISGLGYTIWAIASGNFFALLVAVFLILVSVTSRYVFVVRYRKAHVSMAAEQIDLIQRLKGKEVSERFLNLIIEMRKEKLTT